ncbi:MAG: hypothetical protein SWX82_29785 [Cyanobacteriota bacterium]|nr:hypothetical protein [Cyanobacteriota bacterium]
MAFALIAYIATTLFKAISMKLLRIQAAYFTIRLNRDRPRSISISSIIILEKYATLDT